VPSGQIQRLLNQFAIKSHSSQHSCIAVRNERHTDTHIVSLIHQLTAVVVQQKHRLSASRFDRPTHSSRSAITDAVQRITVQNASVSRGIQQFSLYSFYHSLTVDQ